MVQWVKDPMLLKVWCRSQLQLRFDPWPWNLHMAQVEPTGEKKKKKFWGGSPAAQRVKDSALSLLWPWLLLCVVVPVLFHT